MKRPLIATVLLAVCSLGLSVPHVMADEAGPQQMTIDEMKSRLNLTPEQQAKIQPYLDTRKARMQDVRSKMNSATSRQDKRAAMQEARQAQDEFVKNVEPILSSDQQAEWKKMRAEAREKMKQGWKERNQ